MIIEVIDSWRKNKKLAVVFNNNRTIHIGDNRYSDYSQHGDKKRKENYIKRHAHNGYTNPYSANTLSRYLLWEYTDLQKAIKQFNKKFFIK
jgi:hypothetical protein